MKTKAIVFSLFLAATAFTFTNCGGKKESEAHDHGSGDAHSHDDAAAAADAAEPQFSVDATFQQQLAGAFKAYVGLKDAFFASDAAKVKAEAETTQKALGCRRHEIANGRCS